MTLVTRFLAVLGLALAAATATAHDQDDSAPGALYTMSNAADANAVLVFDRTRDGRLAPAGVYATGGTGTGGGLGNQGGLLLDEDGERLFVVNAGSDEITVFAVRHYGLQFLQTVSSGGEQPISLTLDDDLLYVLNAGSDSIAGFHVSRRGRLTPLPGSQRPLSGAGTGPAQIGFSPDGRTLVITEKATNRLVSYAVGHDGRPAATPRIKDSPGATPFGFAFDKRRQLFVSEAFGGAPGASALSSFLVGRDARLHTISPSEPTEQTAACWVVVTPNHRFAYVSNTGSGTISGYRTGPLGTLERFADGGVTANLGASTAPIDMAVTPQGSFLYSLNSGNGTLSVLRIGRQGTLATVQTLAGIPAGANGLAVR